MERPPENDAAQTRPAQAAKGRWADLPPCESTCKTFLLQVDTPKIGLVNAVFEGYDDMARVETLDIAKGVLAVQVLSEWEDVFRSAARSLSEQTPLRFLEDGEEPKGGTR